MSVLKVNNIQDATGNNAISIDSSGNVTLAAGFVPQTAMGRRNLIINGAMQVAQRGTSFTGPQFNYVTDRFYIREVTDGAVDVEQSTDAPDGFNNSLKITVTTADASLASSQRVHLQSLIEGNNVAHLKFGTASAETVTLSFWVKSSLTGTFAGTLRNVDDTRAYVYTYTINSANTWERKTITIEGDTTGTWLTGNNIGLRVGWSFGAGSTYFGTADTWQSGEIYQPSSGVVDLISTLNATWYITGVQLEVGSVATPFEHRSYGEELALCMRYYQKTKSAFGIGYGAGVGVNFIYTFPVPMRASPSVSSEGVIQVSDWVLADYTQSSQNISINGGTNVTTGGIGISCGNFSGLTNHRPYAQKPNSTNAITLDAEL